MHSYRFADFQVCKISHAFVYLRAKFSLISFVDFCDEFKYLCIFVLLYSMPLQKELMPFQDFAGLWNIEACNMV